MARLWDSGSGVTAAISTDAVAATPICATSLSLPGSPLGLRFVNLR